VIEDLRLGFSGSLVLSFFLLSIVFITFRLMFLVLNMVG